MNFSWVSFFSFLLFGAMTQILGVFNCSHPLPAHNFVISAPIYVKLQS